MVYRFVKLASRLTCILPRAVRRTAGTVLGELAWQIVPGWRKKMAVENLVQSLALDESKAAALAKASATRFGKMFVEVLYLPKVTRGNIDEHVTIVGREHLDDALAHGQGAVLATAHSGNWEVLGTSLAMKGYPLVAVVKKQRNAAMDRFINEYRTMVGMHVTYKTGVREMVKLLGEGKIIGLLMDQDANQNGVFVDFFGRPASTPQGAAALARLKDAPVVPAFITENEDGSHTAILHPPVWVEKTGDRDEDIRRTTQYLTKVIEDHIRTYPHEWFWLHNRWKTRPPAVEQ